MEEVVGEMGTQEGPAPRVQAKAAQILTTGIPTRVAAALHLPVKESHTAPLQSSLEEYLEV